MIDRNLTQDKTSNATAYNTNENDRSCAGVEISDYCIDGMDRHEYFEIHKSDRWGTKHHHHNLPSSANQTMSRQEDTSPTPRTKSAHAETTLDDVTDMSDTAVAAPLDTNTQNVEHTQTSDAVSASAVNHNSQDSHDNNTFWQRLKDKFSISDDEQDGTTALTSCTIQEDIRFINALSSVIDHTAQTLSNTDTTVSKMMHNLGAELSLFVEEHHQRGTDVTHVLSADTAQYINLLEYLSRDVETAKTVPHTMKKAPSFLKTHVCIGTDEQHGNSDQQLCYDYSELVKHLDSRIVELDSMFTYDASSYAKIIDQSSGVNIAVSAILNPIYDYDYTEHHPTLCPNITF